VTFTPPAGSITVASGGCSPPICVTIPRPAGLTATNATACYALNIVNDATGNTHTCTGTIRADNSCWCATPVSTGIVYVGRSAVGTGIAIGIGYPCDPVTSLPYRLVAKFTNEDHPDPLELSLNGLPPGEPVIGTLDRQPGQPGGEIDVNASYPNGYDGFAPYEIVLEADTDGDGQYEPLCVTRVQASYDSTETVAVPGDSRLLDSVKLLAAPNPFFGGSKIDFTLARTDRGDLTVFDLSGRKVRTLASGAIEAGVHRLDWNGRDDHGQPAPAGVYFVRLSTDRLLLESKLVKLR
jgi:FlgD Ig-like domain